MVRTEEISTGQPPAARPSTAAAAAKPISIPTLIRRTFLSYALHADGIYAGAMAFFGTLSLFPLLLLLITLFSLLVRSSDAANLVVARVSSFLPGSGSLIAGVIAEVTTATPIALTLSLGGLLWSSMGVFLTLGYALNRAWNARSDRNIIGQYFIAAGLAFSVGLVVVVSLIASALANLLFFVAGPLLKASLPAGGSVAVLSSNLIDFVVVCSASAFLYRAMPNADVKWRDVLLPAFLVGVAGGAAKFGFTWYLDTIARVGRIYGPVAAIAGLMLWLFVASVLLLWGAELSHQIAIWRADRGQRPPLT
ncbi:MAG: YihY/virulence factor BrkB family protein [Chloroflexota bacterium]